ncbi:hypothetical protein UFOVP930_52 [uncultured Caudovirales phage]|uniref:Uncharacterized protein n=1 Tax=uncultured Caudovirales phage TaxID=2100421 RepID=A0A6J5PMB2_9CAUD|nr:hypothetical protein UFOVP930_52 [uncultured Caudovirales phage]CAB4199911.1 hypothetical protein UFOVP1354_14 [uncultured Caudovirales phage]CAB5238539.1 hypothetical protein UFOVP1547_41 [uncultured Caudovirales phage]
MKTDSLFNLEPTKPTPLQAARRALADAERDYNTMRDQWKDNSVEIEPYRRAVNRFAELVKASELAELNNTKQ